MPGFPLLVPALITLALAPIAACVWWLTASRKRDTRRALIAERMNAIYKPGRPEPVRPAPGRTGTRRPGPVRPSQVGRHMRLAAAGVSVGVPVPVMPSTRYHRDDQPRIYDDGCCAECDLGGRHRLIEDQW